MGNDMHRDLAFVAADLQLQCGLAFGGVKHTHVCISPLLFFSMVKSIHTQRTLPYPLTVSLISFLVTL